MSDDTEELLFPLPEPSPKAPKFKRIEDPIWTKHKAQLIRRYIKAFTYVTRHGTYIDGFAGPQRIALEDRWAASLVARLKPGWIRNFWLFETDPEKVLKLKALEVDPDVVAKNRTFRIFEGDFNKRIAEALAAKPIRAKEATFCLLDQRTFECHWDSVRRLACHKAEGNKIELFYFLANHWFCRAGKRRLRSSPEVLEKWWGRSDFAEVIELSSIDRMQALRSRFTDELGYRVAKGWPIYGKVGGGKRVMFWMIHATDYPDASNLMHTAYLHARDITEPTDDDFKVFKSWNLCGRPTPKLSGDSRNGSSGQPEVESSAWTDPADGAVPSSGC